MRAGISLGSNLGDRTAHLDAAVREVTALSTSPETSRVSSYHETAPVDCPPDSDRFLNATMEIEWSGSPLDLLHSLQAIETAHGRPKIRATNSPRPLDLDLLYLGEIRLDSPELTLPHPRMLDREFVLRPLAELQPDVILRFGDTTLQQILLTYLQ